MTTRLIGAAIMVHGDDSGLVLPPRIAPYQVVIVPIGRDDWREKVLPKAQDIQRELVAAGIRVTIDERDERPGWKFAEWELRGVPLRLEIGPKDIEKSAVLIARRDTREKQSVAMDGLAARLRELLDDVQKTLFTRAVQFPRRAHAARGRLRRLQADDGRPAGIHHRAVVRGRRLRNPDQERHAGDDPEHAAEPSDAVRKMHSVRPAGDRGGMVRESVLTRAG
jgi:hypothetical protein